MEITRLGKRIARVCMYGVFFILLMLMWAKPVSISDEYTEVDKAGHILRINGKPFIQYLADQGVDIHDIDIADKAFYLNQIAEHESKNGDVCTVEDSCKSDTKAEVPPLSADSSIESEEHDLEEHKESPAHTHSHNHQHSHKHNRTTSIREEDKHPYLAILLTTVSAMAATVGGAVVVFAYPPSNTILGHMLSFSAGIMLYISYMDIMVHAQYDLGEQGMLFANLWMFAGMVGFLLVTSLIPEPESSANEEEKSQRKLEMTGLITALGISMHNFPEGLVVFNATVVGVCDLPPAAFSLSYMLQYLTRCTGRGLVVAVAIAIHNIPEGIAVALPIYYSTKSKWQAMKWCLLSSVCEPLAAILFGLFFHEYITEYTMAVMNAVVAGIMIILCVYELIPTALQYTSPRNVAMGTIAGQFIMFVSLYFLIETGAH